MTALFKTARSSTPEVNKTRSWLRPTGENFVLRRLAHGVVDQCLAERPDRAGNLVTGGDHGIERRLDPVAILLGDGQRRQQLDGVAAVAGDLRENLVILEQRHRNELAEEALVGGFENVPGRLQPQRLWRTEL